MPTLKDLPWVRIAVEGVVIVVSILLALGLEAWWSDVETRRSALRELGSVGEELAEVRAQLDLALRWNRRAEVGTVAARDFLLSVPAGANVPLPDTVLLTSLFVQANSYPTSVVDAFIASGYPQELDSPELRRRLLAWSSRVADFRSDELRAREQRNDMSEALTEAGADIGPAFVGGPAGSRLFAAGPEAPLRSSGIAIPVRATVQARNARGRNPPGSWGLPNRERGGLRRGSQCSRGSREL